MIKKILAGDIAMEQNPQEVEAFVTIDPKYLLGRLRQWAWLLLLVSLLGMVIAYVFSRLQVPVYQAKTQVMITRSASEGPVTDITQALTSQQITQTYVEFVSQRWALDSVAKQIGGTITGEQVKVSTATNTQIINIVVEDPDPSRAARIADTLVGVLIEQNENIQSGRYADAEKSLDAQIQRMEEQIANTQKELEQAKSDALAQQIAKTEGNIESTQLAIAATQAEIDNLSVLTPGQVRAMLISTDKRVQELKARLSGQLTEDEGLSIQQEIQSLQEKTVWLTPLVEPGIVEKTLAEKQENLAMQHALLDAYQEIYVSLLTSGKIEGTTDRIAKLEENLSLYQQIYINLLDDHETILLMDLQNMPNVVRLAPAVVSWQPVRPHTIRNGLLGGLASFVVAIIILLLKEFSDNTIKSADQVNEQLKLPVIGYIPKTLRTPKIHVHEYPRSRAAEAFRMLRTNLDFENADGLVKLLLVASPNNSKEKSDVAANLAITLAQGGKHVLLIDADLRHPQIHRSLGLANGKGLSDMIRDSASFEQVVLTWKEENLTVMTSGDLPPNPADLMASENLTEILNCARDKTDIVVIDSPSFLVADASILAAKVDGVLLVMQPGQTPMGTAQFALEQLKRGGARVLGVVLNQIPRGSSDFSTLC